MTERVRQRDRKTVRERVRQRDRETQRKRERSGTSGEGATAELSLVHCASGRRVNPLTDHNPPTPPAPHPPTTHHHGSPIPSQDPHSVPRPPASCTRTEAAQRPISQKEPGFEPQQNSVVQILLTDNHFPSEGGGGGGGSGTKAADDGGVYLPKAAYILPKCFCFVWLFPLCERARGRRRHWDRHSVSMCLFAPV